MSVLSIKNLNISATAPLVRDVSFDINKGEILALVGESGSGKTLTALSVMGLLPAGLSIQGEISPNYKTLRGSRVGMIFQEPMTSLNPLHTIEKQIGECIRLGIRDQGAGVSKKKFPTPDPRPPSPVRARVCELLDKVGLAHFKDRLNAYPHQLSGGERQRVMIAMAIANNPILLIADEPTTALDVTIQAQILLLLKELQQSLGMAVLLITHDLGIVRRIAERVAIMSQGAIVETGSVKEIFNAPQHPYTQKLLASELNSAPLAAVPSTPLIECSDLCVAFPVGQRFFSWKSVYQKVLNHISLNVPAGSTLGIVGESGSGKTSLALALLRLTASEGVITFQTKEGVVRLDTLTGKALRAQRQNMQIVFQDPYASLNPRMSAEQIIREGLDIHASELTPAQKEKRVEEALTEVGLTPEMKYRYPHEFSGGQRQRISIARALILRPRLIVLDEPTSALDTTVQAQILELLKDLQRKYGLTYIFISHDLRVVRAISHRIMVLSKGQMVESGNAEAIFRAPKEEYTRTLLKAAFA